MEEGKEGINGGEKRLYFGGEITVSLQMISYRVVHLKTAWFY